MKVPLIYKGGKKPASKVPFTFTNPQLKTKITFPDTQTIVWVEDWQADFLIKNNPIMFIVPQDMEEPVPVEEDTPEEEKFVCNNCGKEYSDKFWYDKHMEKHDREEDD